MGDMANNYSTFLASSQLTTAFTDPAIVLSMFMLSFTDPAIVLSMFMLSFIFVIVCGLFEWKRVCIGNPRGEGWNPINPFNPTTFLCLFQVRTWISNVICHGHFVFRELR